MAESDVPSGGCASPAVPGLWCHDMSGFVVLDSMHAYMLSAGKPVSEQAALLSMLRGMLTFSLRGAKELVRWELKEFDVSCRSRFFGHVPWSHRS